MLKLNSELRAQAREALRGKWPMAAVAALIYSAIAGGLSAIPVIGGLCSLFVGLPVAYGFAIVMLGVFKGKEIDFGVLFEGFQVKCQCININLPVYFFQETPGRTNIFNYKIPDTRNDLLIIRRQYLFNRRIT